MHDFALSDTAVSIAGARWMDRGLEGCNRVMGREACTMRARVLEKTLWVREVTIDKDYCCGRLQSS